MTSPEVKYAKRLLEKYEQSPPIDVETIAREYADLEYDEIPFEIDGVSLNLKVSGTRPRIIVNRNFPHTRQRFTLAHEIGHVIIPWHYGSIVDDIQGGIGDVVGGYSEIELEANRFAAELLMPSAWIKGLLDKNESLSAVLEITRSKADVSPIAAGFKLVSDLSPGVIFAVINRDNTIAYSARSLGTIASVPSSDVRVADPKSVYPYCEYFATELYGDQQYVWWRLPAEAHITDNGDSREWREVLEEILSDLGVKGTEKEKFRQSVNGVIGYANSATKRRDGYSEARICAAAMQRFHGKPQYTGLLKHKDFQIFIKKRASAMFRED